MVVSSVSTRKISNRAMAEMSGTFQKKHLRQNTKEYVEGIRSELNEMFQNDIEHCTQLTPEFWKKRSPWKKFVGWFANLFTPFL